LHEADTPAKAFAEAGDRVVLADIDEPTVCSAAEALVSAGQKAMAVRCTVADEAEVTAMMALTISTFGRLDVAYSEEPAAAANERR
jgi:NAD(P)-dependent dehydrogenase (short-subunit alcohol dehydrogenase family)